MVNVLKISDTLVKKCARSKDYNFDFNKNTGFFARWGRTLKDDPEFAPSPEILDIEVSTICHQACPFCYKSNTTNGKNMTFDTFKIVLDKMPKTLTQIAIGIGSIDANPDLFKMMDYSRSKGIIPNVTINGERMTGALYDRLAQTCGAVAVSLYDKDTCYNAVKELTDRGMKQVNIHALLSKETYMKCYETLLSRIIDPRLAGLNAVVFLWLKPKGERNQLHQVESMKRFQDLIETAMEVGGSFGFDSCSAPMFLRAVKDNPNFEQYKVMAESCESFGLFSGYINTDARYFPCSFAEGVGEWQEGIDVLTCNDFVKDIWNHPLLDKYRKRSLAEIDCNGCRKCLIYDLEI
uniref:Putative radical SAM superfamily protein n=1 Tax=viral metagenome TaxID=1070528 RepID=A0A6M3KY95_9ZZZZ